MGPDPYSWHWFVPHKNFLEYRAALRHSIWHGEVKIVFLFLNFLWWNETQWSLYTSIYIGAAWYTMAYFSLKKCNSKNPHSRTYMHVFTFSIKQNSSAAIFFNFCKLPRHSKWQWCIVFIQFSHCAHNIKVGAFTPIFCHQNFFW